MFQILEDRHGNFWIGSNKGIFRVSRRELNDMAEGRLSRITSVAFGKADGMLNSECNGGRQPAGLVDREGRLWFPTMGGVVVVDPEAAPLNPLPPPVLIESVMVERDRGEFQPGAAGRAWPARCGDRLHGPEPAQAGTGQRSDTSWKG